MSDKQQWVSNGGRPIRVKARDDGKGVIVSQSDSWLVIGRDEIQPLIDAIRAASA